ncbi:MAG: hypothetical protein JNM21_10485 [Taibaiella sp.]|nr:hypothetical protein [Taibaiella sp.]
MKRKQPYPVFYLFILLSFLPAWEINAQNTPLKACKAQVKANRNKLFRYDSYKAIASEFQVEPYTISFIYKDKGDSIYIHNAGEQLIAALEVDKNGTINSPVSLDYVAKGLKLTDSIVPGGERRKLNAYFEGLLSSNSVLWTADRNAGRKLYYGIGGQDSLSITDLKERGREMTWYSSGLDSLKKRWNEAGNLVYERTLTSEKIWDEQQQLIQHTFDSLVQNKWRVRCKKSWYPTGILSSETFHYWDTPCLAWKYYNERGKLVRTVKHKTLKGTPVEYGIGIVPPREEMIFRAVYQKEAVAVVFNNALNDRLATLLCQATVALEGIYTVRVNVTDDGAFVFKDIEGLHAAAIGSELAAFFYKQAKVKPAVRNGRPFGQLLKLTLKVIPEAR